MADTSSATQPEEISKHVPGAEAPAPYTFRPLPIWKVFGLDIVSGILWLATIALDLGLHGIIADWLRATIHVALMFAVPLLAILFNSDRLIPRRRHAASLYLLAILLLLIVAIPSLPLYTAPRPYLAATACADADAGRGVCYC